MLERFRRKEGSSAHAGGSRSATTTADHAETRVVDRDHDHTHDRDHTADRDRFDRHDQDRGHDTGRAHHEREHATSHTGLSAGTMRDARARQREEYGGINWGAAFFGWLAAAGLGAILAGLVSAAGATLALGEGDQVNGGTADTIGIAGGIAMLVVLVIAYFAGGYVAGRMSRFDGARQGLGVWIIAIAVTVILAAAGAVLGGEYNVLSQLNLPRIPVDEGSVATGALIALALAVIGTLLAAMAGGKAGERYHRKVDRVAVDH